MISTWTDWLLWLVVIEHALALAAAAIWLFVARRSSAERDRELAERDRELTERDRESRAESRSGRLDSVVVGNRPPDPAYYESAKTSFELARAGVERLAALESTTLELIEAIGTSNDRYLASHQSATDHLRRLADVIEAALSKQTEETSRTAARIAKLEAELSLLRTQRAPPALRPTLSAPSIGDSPSSGSSRVGSVPTALAPRPVEPEQAFRQQIVFFGTDRHPAQAPVYFGTDRSTLRLGHCVLTVPEKRKTGSIPRPGFFSSENPERHYILHEVNEENEESFLGRLRDKIATDSRRQVLVFIHGFNVTFVDAVYRTAQMAADLEFAGAAALFSWPSVSDLSKNGYIADMEQADYAVEHLPAFLHLVSTQTGAQMVHIIAHSMGNRLLMNAIQKVKLDAPTIKFTELMLTAPDIDTDVFVTQIAPSVAGAARRTTLYVSSKDEALHWSNRFRPRPRAGDSSSEVVIVDGIETVDVSDVSTGFVGHSYYGDNRSVLTDIHSVMRGVIPAERFGLRQGKFQERTYWLFRP